MATVQDLLNILDDKLLAYSLASALDTPGGTNALTKKIRALNAGHHKVWQILVAAGKDHRTNWFGAESSEVFASGSRTSALPADFHDLLWAESPSVLMKAGSQHRMSWQQDRQNNTSVAPSAIRALYYLVTGDHTPNLEISRKTTGVTVDVHYTSILPEWTAAGDNSDRIPTPFYDAICNWAASSLINSAQSPAVAAIWFQKWQDDKVMIAAAAARRQLGDVISGEGFDSAG